MEPKNLVAEHGHLPPGRHLHYVFQTLSRPIPLAVSVIDRHDLGAEAVLDKEGWVVIVLTNVTDIPIVITPLEPVRLLILPANRQKSFQG